MREGVTGREGKYWINEYVMSVWVDIINSLSLSLSPPLPTLAFLRCAGDSIGTVRVLFPYGCGVGLPGTLAVDGVLFNGAALL